MALKCKKCGKPFGQDDVQYWLPVDDVGRNDLGVCRACLLKATAGGGKIQARSPLDRPGDDNVATASQHPNASVRNLENFGDAIRKLDDLQYVRGVQTVEQTGKGWKIAKLVGWCWIIAGLLATCSEAGSVENGVPIVLLGVAILIAAKVGAWWCHG